MTEFARGNVNVKKIVQRTVIDDVRRCCIKCLFWDEFGEIVQISFAITQIFPIVSRSLNGI